MSDPIVDEIHRYREARARKFNYDIRAMTEDVRARHAGNPNLVDLSKEASAKRARVAEERAHYGKDKPKDEE